MEQRKAIRDGSVTRHWQRQRVQSKELQRLEEREKPMLARGQHTSPTTNTPPLHHTPTVSLRHPNQYHYVKT